MWESSGAKQRTPTPCRAISRAPRRTELYRPPALREALGVRIVTFTALPSGYTWRIAPHILCVFSQAFHRNGRHSAIDLEFFAAPRRIHGPGR